MAKPIFVIKLNQSFLSENDNTNLGEQVAKSLGNEYHVIITATENESNSFECFNDCKGLPDIDIEKLIKDFQNGKA